MSLYNKIMTFVDEAIRDNAVHLYMLDDDAPFHDYSGNNNTAYMNGTPQPRSISVVSGAKYSQVVGPTNDVEFVNNVFKRGKESSSFTLELWMRIINPGSLQQVLSRFGTFDGFIVQGNRVAFGTSYENAGDAFVSYDVQQEQVLHLVGVHTESKNALYVNGELVGEFNLTQEQQSNPFTIAGDIYSLYSGGGSSPNQSFAVNGIAVYAKALRPDAITRHYRAGTDVPSVEEVVVSHGGEVVPVSIDAANVFLDQWWTTDEHWNTASLFDVAVVDGQLRPQFQDGISVPGTWLDSFALDSVEEPSIYGVTADWNGEGITVEASVEDGVWETLERGKKLSIIPNGFEPRLRVMEIRVTFPGGIANDESYLDNLNFVGLSTLYGQNINGRQVSYYASTPNRDFPPTLV